MRMAKAFVIKMGIYTVVFIYILLDLFVFHGPLKKAVEKRSGGGRKNIVHQMQEDSIAAFVYRQPIYLSQVDYLVTQNLAMIGASPEMLTIEQLKHLRTLAVVELVDNALFRIKVDHNEVDVPIEEKEIEATLTRFEERFLTQEELEKECEKAGVLGEKELRLRSKAMLQQDKYIAMKLEPSIVVEDSAVQAFYDRNAAYHKSEFADVKNEIKEALRAQLLAKQLKTYRRNLRAFAGVIHRHLDSSKDTKSLEGDVDCRVEFFLGLFEKPFTIQK